MGRGGLMRRSGSSIEGVRQQVKQWRKTRANRGKMPKELWDAAAALAREQGVYPVSRALRISYDSLKKHASEVAEVRTGIAIKRQARQSAGFVECGSIARVGGTASGIVVELVGVGGHRLTVRLPGSTGVDVASLVRELWSYAG